MAAIIDEILIQDYRSCIKTKIGLQPDLSVLIGPNGSGKTNILKAITLLRSLSFRSATPEREDDFEPEKSKIRVVFLVDGKRVIYTAKLDLRTDEENFDRIISSDETWYARDFTGKKKRYHIPLSLAGMLGSGGMHQHRSLNERVWMMQIGAEWSQELAYPLKVIFDYVRGLRYYGASEFTNPANCPVSFEIEKQGTLRRSVRVRGHSQFLYELYLGWKTATEQYARFLSIIGPSGMSLVDGIEFDEIQTSENTFAVRTGGQIRQRKRETILVVPRFKIGNNTLSPSQLSEGTFKTLILLFFLMTRSSSLLLVEEPEVCVHHGLLTSIIELIKTYSDEQQIILSTHSDFVLDQVDPENVYKIQRDANFGTTVVHITKAMSKNELEALREYMSTEGNLGDYWRHGGLDEVG